MPCPLFVPERPVADYCAGHCWAQAAVPIEPDKLRRCCNRGYARNFCEQAATADEDAVQFLVTSECAGVVEIAWSLERNHHPVAVGNLSIEPGFVGATPLELQAVALAKAYLEQKGIVE